MQHFCILNMSIPFHFFLFDPLFNHSFKKGLLAGLMAAGTLPRAPAARAIASKAGALSKKPSRFFSSFLKILVDKSVGVCYYN